MTRLRLWRTQNGYSRQYVASLVGIGCSTLAFLETGRLIPSASQRAAFRRAFGAGADSLFDMLPTIEVSQKTPAF